MDWKEIVAIIAPLLLIAMKGEIGELKGAVGTLQSQTPTP